MAELVGPQGEAVGGVGAERAQGHVAAVRVEQRAGVGFQQGAQLTGPAREGRRARGARVG